jgi:beta-glucosidase
VQDGSLTVDEIDEMVRPILTLKVKMGLFENPYVDETLLDQVVARPEHRQAARLAAQRSMVLLRNEGNLLPLAKDMTNVAVIGPLADSMQPPRGRGWCLATSPPP